MMRRTDNQIQLSLFDIDSMIPQNHLLRQLKNCVSFEFIYEKAVPYYSQTAVLSVGVCEEKSVNTIFYDITGLKVPFGMFSPCFIETVSSFV